MDRVTHADFERDGYSVHQGVLEPELRAAVVDAFAALDAERAAEGGGGSKRSAGVRSGLDAPAIAALAASEGVRRLVEPILGPGCFAFRATLFDKSRDRNWPVAWHQDRVVPVVAKVDAAEFGQWSNKAEGLFVEPPPRVQQDLVAVRVDIDGSGPHNGGLRLLPGSHDSGVWTREQIADAAEALPSACPKVVPGGAIRMRPLLVHSSRRMDQVALPTGRRRIVHFEFFAGQLPGGAEFPMRVGPPRE